MKLKEKIAQDFINAFKQKDALRKSLLSTVKGEVQTLEKNLGVDTLSDDEVIKILNKFAKSLKENVSLGDDTAKKELDIIQNYLPKEMSDDEIENKVSEIISSGVSNIGMIMKEFAGLQADKKKVSEIARKMINS
jgi:uncharacterized protein YqeY